MNTIHVTEMQSKFRKCLEKVVFKMIYIKSNVKRLKVKGEQLIKVLTNLELNKIVIYNIGIQEVYSQVYYYYYIILDIQEHDYTLHCFRYMVRGLHQIHCVLVKQGILVLQMIVGVSYLQNRRVVFVEYSSISSSFTITMTNSIQCIPYILEMVSFQISTSNVSYSNHHFIFVINYSQTYH